jgi:hypothetical protein
MNNSETFRKNSLLSAEASKVAIEIYSEHQLSKTDLIAEFNAIPTDASQEVKDAYMVKRNDYLAKERKIQTYSEAILKLDGFEKKYLATKIGMLDIEFQEEDIVQEFLSLEVDGVSRLKLLIEEILNEKITELPSF